MKKWDNGTLTMPVSSCMTCPEHRYRYGRRKISGQWVTSLQEAICKRTGIPVKLMGIAESCPLPDYEGGKI